MIYIYDILLNWTKDSRLKEFYEWNLEDDLEHIKKIPIIRVSEKFIKDLLTSKIRVDKAFLPKIKDKAESYFHNDIDTISYAVIVSCDKKALALELDNAGNIIYKSSMLLDEEEEVLEMILDLQTTNLSYQVIKKNKAFNFLTRQEEEEKKFLIKELKKMKNNKESAKINYLYQEFFQDQSVDYNTKVKLLESEINKEYSNFHKKLFKLLKLTTIKRK